MPTYWLVQHYPNTPLWPQWINLLIKTTFKFWRWNLREKTRISGGAVLKVEWGPLLVALSSQSGPGGAVAGAGHRDSHTKRVTKLVNAVQCTLWKLWISGGVHLRRQLQELQCISVHCYSGTAAAAKKIRYDESAFQCSPSPPPPPPRICPGWECAGKNAGLHLLLPFTAILGALCNLSVGSFQLRVNRGRSQGNALMMSDAPNQTKPNQTEPRSKKNQN